MNAATLVYANQTHAPTQPIIRPPTPVLERKKEIGLSRKKSTMQLPLLQENSDFSN